jgi:hypothetical protein
MNKTFKEFKQMDAQEMEEFFRLAAYYFQDNAEDLPNLPALEIAGKLIDCYSYMKERLGN